MTEPLLTYSRAACAACGGTLNGYREDDYSKCVLCGSFCYLGSEEGEESNRRYFESKEVWDVPESGFKDLLMRIMERLDRLLRADEYAQFDAAESKFTHLAITSSSVMEIGFGDGSWLVWALENGLDAKGIDLSSHAVSRFQERHSSYADRVEQSTELKGTFNLVYANAVFEHIENPSQFLENIASTVAPGGWLVLGLPIRSAERTTFPTSFDINFWRPYHRAIYSAAGLSILMRGHGFTIETEATIDRYAYRVMNILLRNGDGFVSHVRTPIAQTAEGPSLIGFLKVMFDALWVRSPSVWARVVARKSNS